MPSTYLKQMQRIVNEYIEAGQKWPATTRQMAQWAIKNKKWAPQPSAIVDQCADQLAKAMKEEYITDAKGRVVRAKHAARVEINGEQTTLWADIRTADRKHMEIAFKQRRGQILGECRQLKADVDSYNDYACPNNPIPMILDFTYDLMEEALAS